MPVALVTGAARANSIAAGIVPRLVADGWDVATSDLHDSDYDCDVADPAAPERLIGVVARERGPITALVLSHAHDELSGILDTTAASFDAHVAINARASLLAIAAFARQAQAQDFLAPYQVQTWDDIPEGQKDPEGHWYNDYGGYISIGCNATIVGECPQTMQDLLDPRYAGQVALNGNPTQAAAAFAALFTGLSGAADACRC